MMSAVLFSTVSYDRSISISHDNKEEKEQECQKHIVSLNMNVFLNNMGSSPPEFCEESVRIKLSGSDKTVYANRLILCLASNGFTGLRLGEDLVISSGKEKALEVLLECLHQGRVQLESRGEVRDVFEVASRLGIAESLIIVPSW